MEREEQMFEQLLEEFRAELDLRGRSLEAQMMEAKKMLESDHHGLRVTQDVRHTPISARLKDKDKALRTLRRRQEDRQRLRELKEYVEAREPGSWEQYCREWNMMDKKDEAEPFQSLDDMFDAMHDLAGIRISLYFPNDVHKVIRFLDHTFDIVEKPSRKGGLARDYQKIRNLVERQRRLRDTASWNGDDDTNDMVTASSVPESTFDGYQATHVVIRHKQSNLDFDKHVRSENLASIEVQIGSIIMHAWSDIEHDILYKPSQTVETSPDLVRMLDLINGIVMTGEVALQQLASVAAAQAAAQAEYRQQKAYTWQYMVPWIDKYCADRNLPRPVDLKFVAALFRILKATDEHTVGRVEELLDEIGPQPDHPTGRLPALILNHLGKDTYPFQDRGFEPQWLATTWNARYWATCLVNTISFHIFLNTFGTMRTRLRQDYYDPESNPMWDRRPTFAEYLDILHPTKPQRRTDRQDKMIAFCKHILSIRFSEEHEWYALIAMKLASAGYTVRPRFSDEQEQWLADYGDPSAIFIPGMLQFLTYEHQTTFLVVLSAIHTDLRLSNRLFFMPRSETEDDRAWTPVTCESQEWVITRTGFHHDPNLVFEDDRLSRKYVDHLVRLLDVRIEPPLKEEEVRPLIDVAKDLGIANKYAEMSLLLERVRGLGVEETKTLYKKAEGQDET